MRKAQATKEAPQIPDSCPVGHRENTHGNKKRNVGKKIRRPKKSSIVDNLLLAKVYSEVFAQVSLSIIALAPGGGFFCILEMEASFFFRRKNSNETWRIAIKEIKICKDDII